MMNNIVTTYEKFSEEIRNSKQFNMYMTIQLGVAKYESEVRATPENVDPEKWVKLTVTEAMCEANLYGYMVTVFRKYLKAHSAYSLISKVLVSAKEHLLAKEGIDIEEEIVEVAVNIGSTWSKLDDAVDILRAKQLNIPEHRNAYINEVIAMTSEEQDKELKWCDYVKEFTNPIIALMMEPNLKVVLKREE